MLQSNSGLQSDDSDMEDVMDDDDSPDETSSEYAVATTTSDRRIPSPVSTMSSSDCHKRPPPTASPITQGPPRSHGHHATRPHAGSNSNGTAVVTTGEKTEAAPAPDSPTAFRPGRLTNIEILERIFPLQKRHVLELVLTGCNGDLVKAIEQFLSVQDTFVVQQQRHHQHHAAVIQHHLHQQHQQQQQHASGQLVNPGPGPGPGSAQCGVPSSAVSIMPLHPGMKSAFSPSTPMGNGSAFAVTAATGSQPSYNSAFSPRAAAFTTDAILGRLPGSMRHTVGALGGHQHVSPTGLTHQQLSQPPPGLPHVPLPSHQQQHSPPRYLNPHHATAMSSLPPSAAIIPPVSRLGGALESWLHSAQINLSPAAAVGATNHPFFMGHGPFMRQQPSSMTPSSGPQTAPSVGGSSSFAEQYMQIMSAAAAAAVAAAGNGLRGSPTSVLGSHLHHLHQHQQSRHAAMNGATSPLPRKRRHIDECFYRSDDEVIDRDAEEHDLDEQLTDTEDESLNNRRLNSHQLGPLDLHRGSRHGRYNCHHRGSGGRPSPTSAENQRHDDLGGKSVPMKNNGSCSSNNNDSDVD